MNGHTYGFKGKVVERTDPAGKYTFTLLQVPKKVAKELPLDQYPRLRIRGEVNGHSFEGALQPSGGRWSVMLSRRRMKEFNIKVGESVTIGFEIADQDAVDVPPELQQALEEDRDAANVWDAITPGKRRGFAYRISSAKQPATRARRVAEVLTMLDELRD